MSDKSCPNCDEPIGICNGSYSQSCWQKKAEKLQVRLAQLTDDTGTYGTDEERVRKLSMFYASTQLSPSQPMLPMTYGIRQENLALLLELARKALEPLQIAALYCPVCKTRHIDEGEFATKKHHTHACQGFVMDSGKRRRCGHVWRPALVATVGVEALPGFINEEPHAER